MSEIGINGNYNTYLSPDQKIQTRVKDLQKKVDNTSQETGSSGKNGYYSDVKNTRLYLSFEDDLSKTESSLQDLVFMKGRQDKMRESITRIKNIAGKLQVKLQEENSAKTVKDNTSFQIFLKETQHSVSNLLKTEFNGEYIFSGQASTTVPIGDISDLGAIPAGSAADYSYYTGSKNKIVEYIDDDQALPFSDTAENAGVENLIRAMRLSLSADPSTTLGKARLEDAQKMCEQSFSKLSDLEHFVGININEIENKTEEYSLDKVRLSSNIKDMGFRDQLDAWMDYFSNKGQQELVRAHWIETIKSTNELIKSL
jgi:hypothetical protein